MTIWLTTAVEKLLVASAENLAPFETGGMLLGWRDESDRIITDIVGPGDRALHGRYAFVPDHRWQKQQLGSAFARRSEEHTSELQSLMRISYAVFCLKKKKKPTTQHTTKTR